MKESAEHAYFSHMHDGVKISDAFPVTGKGLDERDDQEDETEQSLSISLHTRVLSLGGAKRRFIPAAAKYSCGAF